MLAYGPDFLALARRGTHYVDQILKGAKPGELPIEQPAKFRTVINLKTAKSLGLEIPASLIADDVIETGSLPLLAVFAAEVGSCR